MSRTAVIYVRISRDKEGAGLGVERQRADCEDLARRLGWTVTEVYVDNDISAYSGKPRPAYHRMLADLQGGRATAVLVWHTDRLHRSPAELEEYITICETAGVITQTVKAGHIDLSTPSGRMIARQLGAVARFEVEHMSERRRRAKEATAQAGEWLGGRRPFGYEADGVTIRPSEAAEIRRVADELLAGTSVRAVTRDLNARGVPTSTGGTWTANAVRRMILRARNAGLMEHRGEVIGRAQWPAILDEATWRAVRALLLDPSRLTIGAPRRHLLSGIAECGICGARMIAATVGSGRGSRSRRVYKCTQTPHIARDVTALERYITMIVLEWLSQPEAAELFAPVGDDGAAARAVERETLRRRQREAAEMFAAGEMTRAQLAAVTAATGKRLAELDQLDAATVHTSALGVFRGGDDVRRVWEGLDIERQRAVIREIMRVVVLPIKRGRPKGWTPEYGREWGYFNPDGVLIERRER